MSKLLIIDKISGRQLIEIEEGGSYFDPTFVLWDESIDGEIPSIDITGAVRIDGDLLFNEEVAAEDVKLKSKMAIAQSNAAIIAELEKNDAKSIRALLEGDQARIEEWKQKQAALRLQLVK